MPTDILQLAAFDGPNLYGPRPGVLLRVRSDKNRTARIKNALKDGAQSVGMVLAYIEVWSEPADGGYTISANFSTPTPAIGRELARYIVAGLNAREAGDEEWDAEGPLWDLQKRRHAEALPLPALQITAEAATRGIPAFVRHDGLAQLGSGARGLAFERCAYSAVTDLPSEQLPDLADRAEMARALGVPMLVTDPDGAVALNADVPEVAALAEYAPCPIIYISTAGENTTVGFHPAAAGAGPVGRHGPGM